MAATIIAAATALGTAVTAGTASGTTAAIIGGVTAASTLASTGIGIAQATGAFDPNAPDLPTLTDPEVEESRRRQALAGLAANRGGTLLTSGRGVQDNVLIGRASLLGQ